jgi:hypothetical protein
MFSSKTQEGKEKSVLPSPKYLRSKWDLFRFLEEKEDKTFLKLLH